MMSFNDFLFLGKFILSKRRTIHGFLVCILFLVLLFLFLPVNVFESQTKIIFFIVLALSFVCWLYVSGRCVWRSKKIKIGIAFQATDPKTQEIIEKTIIKLKNEFKNLGLIEKFTIFFIDHNLFSSNEKVIKYVEDYDVHLVFHGLINDGNYDSKFRCDLNGFSFTYRYYNLPNTSAFKAELEKDLKLIVSNRNWTIEESNTITDIEKVTYNFVEIILSILSITLCRSEQFPDLSIKLIKTVIPYLEKHVPVGKEGLVIDKENKKITGHINILRSGRLRTILNSCYVNSAQYFLSKKDYKKSLEIFNDALTHGADKFFCFQGLAYSSYFVYGIDTAEEYTFKMNSIVRNTLEYYLNMGFFSIMRGQYSEAQNHYNAVRNKINKNNIETVSSTIAFLADRYKENKKEKAFIYAQGILTYNVVDKATGRKLLIEFIQGSKDKKYLQMIGRVKSILKIKD
jgi:tetratricopeptide (TPR) repeat protein